MNYITMKHPIITSLALLFTLFVFQGAELKGQNKAEPNAPVSKNNIPTGLWRSEPPADCPFKPSASITGVEFTGRHAEYTEADIPRGRLMAIFTHPGPMAPSTVWVVVLEATMRPLATPPSPVTIH
jgi:hypothetical protein